MRKAEELYMKHVYTMGGMEQKQDTTSAMEVVINEVNVPKRPGPNNNRPWRNKNSGEISPNKGVFAGQFRSEIHRNPPRTFNEENKQLPRGLKGPYGSFPFVIRIVKDIMWRLRERIVIKLNKATVYRCQEQVSWIHGIKWILRLLL